MILTRWEMLIENPNKNTTRHQILAMLYKMPQTHTPGPMCQHKTYYYTVTLGKHEVIRGVGAPSLETRNSSHDLAMGTGR